MSVAGERTGGQGARADHRRVSGVGVLDKSIAILEAVEAGVATLGELVRATGLSRATAHRLAAALEAHGLLGRAPSGGFVLGLRLLALGAAAATDAGVRDLLGEVARPALERLRDATGESAQLFVRIGDRRACVATAESPRELRTIVPVGASLPLTAGSAGKVFLGWASPADLDRLLGSWTALTPATPTPDRLRRDAVTARRMGWAESVGEREPGVASVSAPVLDRDALIAVISVSGPIERTGRAPARRYADEVRAAALEVERALGAPTTA